MGPLRAQHHRVWKIGEWTLDEGCQRLVRGTEALPLNPKEMGVLVHLAQSAPDLVSSEQLLARTWPDVVVGDHVLHEVIGRLRKALGDKARQPTYIETLPKRGYRLLVPVAAVDKVQHMPVASDAAARPLLTEHASWLVSHGTLMVVLALSLVSIGVWWFVEHGRLERASSDGQPIGVAILPFVNLSGDPEHDYLGDAIAAEVVNHLRPAGMLRVISMTSSREFKDTGLDIRDVGARLAADYIVEGELLQSDGQVRVSARLIDASGGVRVWSVRDEVRVSDLQDVFKLYEKFAFGVGQAIRVHAGLAPSPTNHIRNAAPPGVDAGAYHLLQRAAFSFEESGNPARALQLVNQALELAPRWPNALNAKAVLLIRQAEFGMIPGDQGFPAARELARQAMAVDSTYGDVRATLGFLEAAIDLDARKAMARFEEAERLGANIELLWPFKEYVLLNSGRYEEALALNREFERISPASAFVKGSVGRLLWRLGRHSEAAAKLEQALKLAPRNLWVCTEVLRYYVYQIQHVERASKVIELCFGNSDQMSNVLRPYWRANLALVAGDPEPLAAIARRAERRSKTEHVDSRSLALMYYRLGRYDKHIEWTSRRVEARQQLIEVPDELRVRPGYWVKFREWALSDPREVRARLELIDEHRQRLALITTGMTL